MNKDDNKPKEITQQAFIRGIQASNIDSSNILYGFILGAGASVKSGIPTASTFTVEWYKEIKLDNPTNKLDEWKKSILGFDKNNLAKFYPEIFEKRFEANQDEGIQQLQKYMDDAIPSIGYSFLAQLLDKTNNKFVITTNFDTMTEDALFQYSNSKPLVLGHESLSHFVQSTNTTRPTIIKIHRDFLLQPHSNKKEIEKLNEKWQEALKPILKNNRMIVIGYGGHDNSLMEYLSGISTQDRKPIYWCYLNEDDISEKAKKLLTKKDFIIKINGFDEFMLMIAKTMEFEIPVNIKEIEKSEIVLKAIIRANDYALQLNDLGEINLKEEEKEAFRKFLSLDSIIYERAALDDALTRVIKYIDTHKMSFFKVKRKDVAKALSIAPETLSRRLKILEKEGIIDRDKEDIDETKLQMYIKKINNVDD